MIYNPEKMLVIAGPCSLESEKVCRAVAQEIVKLKNSMKDLVFVFKGSFDKANRTSLSGARGMGMEDGLSLLKLIKEEYQLPVTTDVHLPEQCKRVGEVCDVLQIPAFMCRQTDLLLAAAQTGRSVNVKKGQFLSPYEMEYVVGKLQGGGAKEIWQTERGTTFGYQNLVVDMRSISIMKAHGHPVIFDATHSVQLPGAAGGQSGGQREFIRPLARAACAAGADGLFLETHPNPDAAFSDAASQIPLTEFARMVERCHAIWKIARQ